MQYISYQNMKDVALWNLILRSDMKALSVLYKRHYELLLNFGLKYTSDENLVKDCIQDIFVKFSTSRRLSPTDYVRSYLLTSLKNAISDKLFSRKVMENLDESSFSLQMEDAAIESLFNKDDEELRLGKKMVIAYNSLPENQRMAIYLRYIRGLSYKEMAVVLNINPQSSMNLVSRALTNLRSKISSEAFLLLLLIFFQEYIIPFEHFLLNFYGKSE